MYLVKARFLIRSSGGHKFLAATRERILVCLRALGNLADPPARFFFFCSSPFVPVVPLALSPFLCLILMDNVVAMVAMGIPSLAFVGHRATVSDFSSSSHSTLVALLSSPSPLSPPMLPCALLLLPFSLLLFSYSTSFGTRSWDVETFIHQRAHFLSDFGGNVIITYPRASSLRINRNVSETRSCGFFIGRHFDASRASRRYFRLSEMTRDILLKIFSQKISW